MSKPRTGLVYDVPPPIPKPFAVGDTVEVCDRNLNALSTKKVIRVGEVVETECGRRWRASDGWWWDGYEAWPFPSIRHCAPPKEWYIAETATGAEKPCRSYAEACRWLNEREPERASSGFETRVVSASTAVVRHAGVVPPKKRDRTDQERF